MFCSFLVGLFSEIFGVAGKVAAWQSRLVDDSLVDRRRDHRSKLTRLATCHGQIEQFKYVGAVLRIQLPRFGAIG
jgi:hypothetical protein